MSWGARQVPVEHWHDVVGDPTFGGAVLDRLLNNAHRITLKGGSMRRFYDLSSDNQGERLATIKMSE